MNNVVGKRKKIRQRADRVESGMSRLITLTIAILILGSCGGGENGRPADIGFGPDSDVADGGEVVSGDTTADGDEPAKEFAAGTAALFLSLALESREESWPTIGGSVSWDETDIGILRYVPAIPSLDLFTSTTSSSFSTNHVYPLTVRDRLFVVSTRGRKRIQEYDARTGNALGAPCEIVTGDNFGGFAIVGSRVFFLNDDGELSVVAFPCDAEAEILAAAGDHGINPDYLFGIGDDLLSVDTRDFPEYHVRGHDTATGAVREVLLTVNEDQGFIVDFFAGDDAVYWAAFDDGAQRLTVTRMPATGSSETVLDRVLTEDLNAGLFVDASGDQVLIVYMDGFPASGGIAHFLRYDITDRQLAEMDVDPSFYSQRALGTQLYVFD